MMLYYFGDLAPTDFGLQWCTDPLWVQNLGMCFAFYLFILYIYSFIWFYCKYYIFCKSVPSFLLLRSISSEITVKP